MGKCPQPGEDVCVVINGRGVGHSLSGVGMTRHAGALGHRDWAGCSLASLALQVVSVMQKQWDPCFSSVPAWFLCVFKPFFSFLMCSVALKSSALSEKYAADTPEH